MSVQPEFVLGTGDDARTDPVRLVVIQDDRRPAVDDDGEPLVMTVPHLLIREAIALCSFSLLLVLLAIFVDAPLEEMADPQNTPNPAKAPWYFLGLQELLHYYPPIISGVLLPALVVVALVVVPYFDVNLERRSLSTLPQMTMLVRLWGSVAVLSLVFLFTGSHPVWPLLGPLWAVAVAMTLPVVRPGAAGLTGWLGRRSLAFWVFLWFLIASTVLTAIGVAFRGPGWAFTLPWRDGFF